MKTAENIDFHLYNIAMCARPQPDFGSFAEECIDRKTLYGFLSRTMHSSPANFQENSVWASTLNIIC